MSDSPDRTLTEPQIARAYIKLSYIPDDSSEALVSLASIKDYEIRMFRGPAVDVDGVPLFWLELFDHSTKRRATASVATRSKRPQLYSTISCRRHVV